MSNIFGSAIVAPTVWFAWLQTKFQHIAPGNNQESILVVKLKYCRTYIDWNDCSLYMVDCWKLSCLFAPLSCSILVCLSKHSYLQRLWAFQNDCFESIHVQWQYFIFFLWLIKEILWSSWLPILTYLSVVNVSITLRFLVYILIIALKSMRACHISRLITLPWGYSRTYYRNVQIIFYVNSNYGIVKCHVITMLRLLSSWLSFQQHIVTVVTVINTISSSVILCLTTRT